MGADEHGLEGIFRNRAPSPEGEVLKLVFIRVHRCNPIRALSHEPAPARPRRPADRSWLRLIHLSDEEAGSSVPP